jgi:hypothetical protein
VQKPSPNQEDEKNMRECRDEVGIKFASRGNKLFIIQINVGWTHAAHFHGFDDKNNP